MDFGGMTPASESIATPAAAGYDSSRSVKRSQALLGSNLTRNSRADEPRTLLFHLLAYLNLRPQDANGHRSVRPRLGGGAAPGQGELLELLLGMKFFRYAKHHLRRVQIARGAGDGIERIVGWHHYRENPLAHLLGHRHNLREQPAVPIVQAHFLLSDPARARRDQLAGHDHDIAFLRVGL